MNVNMTLASREEVYTGRLRKVAAGFLAAFVAVFGIMGATAPKASAQTGIGEAIIAAKTADELCKLVYGENEGGLASCLENIKDSGMEIADIGKCLTKDDAGDTGETGGETEAPAPDGGEENKPDFGSKLDDCLKDDEEEEEETAKQPDDYSLYRMTSALTAFYVNSLVPGGFDAGSDSGDEGQNGGADEGQNGGATAEDTKEGAAGLEGWKDILGKPSTAGAFMAKPNKDNLENKNWLLGYGDANNDAVFTYKAFDRKGEDVPDKGVSQYAYYGATLAGLGFDQTEARDSMDSAKAHMMGYGMMLAFMGAGAVDMIFDGVTGILQTLNPFALIFKPITENTNPTFTEGMRGDGDSNADGAFDGLVDFLSSMYRGFYTLGWEVTIPVFIGIFVAGALLFRRYAIGDGAKKLAIKIAFLTLGVPLLGVTYTSALDSMQGASGESATANAAKIVNSTYVDFEGWVDHRLAPPDDSGSGGLVWNTETNRPEEHSQANARRTALEINKLSSESLKNAFGTASSDSDKTWVTENLEDDDKSDEGVYGTTLSLLNRYISGDRVSAAGFESEVKGELSRLANNSKGQESAILGWVKDFSSADSISSMTADDVANLKNPLVTVNGVGILVTPRDNGYQFGNLPGDNNGEGYGCYPSRIIAGGPESITDAKNVSPASCPMSVLSMYNYLNTRFDTTAATTFSPASSTSSWTREQHQSVNAVGSGITSMVYWFSAMALLVSFMLIGFFYALAMMFGTLKRGVQLIAAIPFATMGFLAGIGKVIVYTISMFLEIFMTIFLFKVVQELLMVVPQIFETKLVGAQNDGDGLMHFVTGNPVLMVVLTTLVSSFVVLFFTFQAIKLRSSIIQALDEAATNVVNKILGTNVSAGASASDGGAVKQGLARGMALGGASWFMGKASGGDDGDSSDANGVAAVGAGAAGAGAGDAGAPTEGGMTGMPDPTAPQDIENGGDQGGDIENADNVDASDGQLPAGDYDVDADGNVTSSDGSIDTDGATLGDVANVDADGNILGSDGQPIPGPDGQPLQASDVRGIDSHGNMIGADGKPLLDQNGGTVAAGGVGSVDAGGTGYAESTFADQAPEDVATTEATAARIASNGLSQPEDMGVGGGTAYGVSGDAGTAETAEFPAQGADGGFNAAGVAGTAAAGFAGARAGQFGDSAEAVSNGGAEMGQGYKTLTGQSNVSGGPAAGPQASVPQGQQGYGPQAQMPSQGNPVQQGYGPQGQMPSQGAPGVPGQAAPVAGQYGVPGQVNGVSNTGGETHTSRGGHPIMGMIGMQAANGAVNKTMGQTTTGRNVHESVTGKQGGAGGQGAGGFNGLNQAGQRSSRGRGRGTGNTMANMAGMQAMNQWGRNGQNGQNGQAPTQGNNQIGRNPFGVDPNAAMRRPDGSLDPRANGSGNPPHNGGNNGQ